MTAIAWSLVGLMAASLGVLATAVFGSFGRMDGLGERMDAGFGRLDARIDGLGERMDAGFGRLDARIDGLGERMDAGFGRLDARIDRLAAGLEAHTH